MQNGSNPIAMPNGMTHGNRLTQQPEQESNSMATATPTLEQQIAFLLAENERMRAEKAAAANRKLTMKVSEKGAVSVYGLGRFPVTLYKTQWTKLIAGTSAIEQFIVDNDASLKQERD
jgi:hypothetical protein